MVVIYIFTINKHVSLPLNFNKIRHFHVLDVMNLMEGQETNSREISLNSRTR